MAKLTKEERLERRQARCSHSWKHATETVHNRLVASTWCRKCMITAHAFEQSRRPSNAKTGE